jgi:hypothetical protein
MCLDQITYSMDKVGVPFLTQDLLDDVSTSELISSEAAKFVRVFEHLTSRSKASPARARWTRVSERMSETETDVDPLSSWTQLKAALRMQCHWRGIVFMKIYQHELSAGFSAEQAMQRALARAPPPKVSAIGQLAEMARNRTALVTVDKLDARHDVAGAELDERRVAVDTPKCTCASAVAVRNYVTGLWSHRDGERLLRLSPRQ